MKTSIEAATLAFAVCLAAGPALSWSCGSEDQLAAVVAPDERARISAEVARQRAIAEALACMEAGRDDCPDLPPLTQAATAGDE